MACDVHGSVDECVKAELILNRDVCKCGNDTWYIVRGVHYADVHCTKCMKTVRVLTKCGKQEASAA